MAAGERTPKQRCDYLNGAMSFRNANTPRRRRRGSRKCLFGAPDHEETRRLMAEQYSRDRKRFIHRFNFDIETECPYKSPKLDSPVKFVDREKYEDTPVRNATEALASLSSNSEPRLLGSPSRRGQRTPGGSPRTPRTPRTPATRRQLHMTDYWPVRKRSESSSSDKEN